MNNIKFYKWTDKIDTYCARVVFNTANYYKNGKIYSLYQKFISQPTDIEITEEEFNRIVGI